MSQHVLPFHKAMNYTSMVHANKDLLSCAQSGKLAKQVVQAQLAAGAAVRRLMQSMGGARRAQL